MKLYSIPKLVKYDDLKKTWYVYFRYKGKVVKFTKEINRLATYKERLQAGELLAKVTLKRLEEGWNPLVADILDLCDNNYTLYQAMEYALNERKPQLSLKTFQGYSGTLRFIKTAIHDLGLGELLVKDTERRHIKLILKKITETRNWSNKAYNKGANHIAIIMNEVVECEILDKSPAENIRRLSVEETVANQPPTPEEAETIKNFLREHHPEQLVFMAAQFHTGIRPVELTRLQIGMIDTERRLIKMPANITKNRKRSRVVPIVPDLWQYLAPMLSVGYPNHYFVFGSYRKPGRGNEGKFRDFIPGPTQMKRDTTTRRWKKLIKDGLGIDVNQYSYKKLGGDAKYNSGIPLEAIQGIFGHSDKSTTEIYVKAVQEHYRRIIIENSPVF